MNTGIVPTGTDMSIVEIWMTLGSHTGGYEEFYLLEYKAEQSGESQPTFRKNISPPFSESKSKLFLLPALCWFLAWFAIWPWIWRQHITPKRRLTSTELHVFIPQKIEIFFEMVYHHHSLSASQFIRLYGKNSIDLWLNFYGQRLRTKEIYGKATVISQNFDFLQTTSISLA
jgi:hypothetical protein